MAQVTVELRNLLKTNFELFDFPYEFDDKNFAKELEQAVIDHYWNYEIGQATPDDFKRVFKRRWLQAVSYYNKLHNTTLLEYNPLINYKMSEALEQLSTSSRTEDNTATTDSTSNTEGTTSSTSNTEGTATSTRTDNTTSNTTTDDKASDYPQQSITVGDYLSGQRTTEVEATNTGTAATEDSNSSDTTGLEEIVGNTTDHAEIVGNTTSSGTDNTHYEKTIEGLTGKTYQELIQLERANLLRITGMVIEEMKPCFILVY